MKRYLFISAVALSICIDASAQNYNSGAMHVNGPVYDASAANGSQVATSASMLVQTGGVWAFNTGNITTPRTSSAQPETVNFNGGLYTRTTGYINGYSSATNQAAGFILPVGQASYTPLTINSALAAGNSLTAAWYDNLPQVSTMISGERFFFMPGYYDINTSIAGVSVKPTVPIDVLAGTRLIGTVNSSTYVDLGPATTNASLPLGVYRLLFANSSTTLPLTLLSFIATKQVATALLTWKVGMEANVQRYVVERSADGRNFGAIGSVSSLGNTNQERVYSLQDASPLKGVNHYRLRMIDVDGKTNYSEVRNLVFESSLDILVYPNPVSDNVRISGIETGMQVSICNMQGQRIVTQKAYADFIDMNIKQLPAAIYDVQVRDANGRLISTSRIAKR